MPHRGSDCDWSIILLGITVFALPLTLLIPDFTIWDVVPKLEISRYHVVSWEFTWNQLNTAMFGILTLLSCFYLEIRRRRLDEMVYTVMAVHNEATTALNQESGRQSATLRGCAQLLDTSTEHYEHLVLLRDELRKRDRPHTQGPPSIEISTSDAVDHKDE